MGTVQAKSFDRDDDVGVKSNFRVGHIKTRVDKIHVEGLGRTKDDVIAKIVRDLFGAQDFKEVIIRIHKVRARLESFGLFKSVSVLIDTSHGELASKDGLEITFVVKEFRRMVGGISTLVGNNEGSVVLGASLPNIAGRGEKIQAEYAHGSKNSTGFNLTFTKPLLYSSHPTITGAVFQQAANLLWSGFNEIDRGLLCELACESGPNVKHSLRWEAVWRELSILPSSRSFVVREEMGHTLKSCVKHTITADYRDDHVLPSKGVLFNGRQEFAGLGGDIGFLKSETELQVNFGLPFDWVLQGSLNSGSLQHRSHDKSYNIADRFFLGGPLTLRGFELRGAGQHDQGCAIGSDDYWGAALHLYTPLPFRPGRGGLGDAFRLQFFTNLGYLGSYQCGNDYRRYLTNLWERRRWSVGAGLVIRLVQVARLEINYCVPMRVEAGDRVCHGLQFGLGVTYW